MQNLKPLSLTFGICGERLAGKDTVGYQLEKQLTLIKIALADSIKQQYSKLLSLPLQDLYVLALSVCFAAFISATQDIALDAYRIELHSERELAAGIATYVLGYRIALIVAGAGALYLAEFLSWNLAFSIMAFCFLIGPIVLVFLPGNQEKVNKEKTTFIRWVKKAVFNPFLDFTKRQSWVWILLFIAIYKLGDALAGNMTTPFLLDIGFSKIQIANIVKVIGLAATLIGLFVGGLLSSPPHAKSIINMSGRIRFLKVMNYP